MDQISGKRLGWTEGYSKRVQKVQDWAVEVAAEWEGERLEPITVINKNQIK